MQVFKSILAKEINGKKVSVYPRTSDDMVYLSDNITTLNNKLNEFESRISQIENPIITNKPTLKIQIFGDSISDPSVDRDIWVNHIQEFIPNYDFDIKNCANAGSGAGHSATNDHASGAMGKAGYPNTNVYDLVRAYERVDGIETSNKLLRTDNDFIIIFIGTNNYASYGRYALGTFGDTMSNIKNPIDGISQTFYGAIRSNIEYIQQSCPTSKLLFCTIAPRYRTSGSNYIDSINDDGIIQNTITSGDTITHLTIQDFNEAITKNCDAYGVPYIDLYKNLCWNRFNINEYTIDGLYPNTLGSQQIAKLITNKIKEYL